MELLIGTGNTGTIREDDYIGILIIPMLLVLPSIPILSMIYNWAGLADKKMTVKMLYSKEFPDAEKIFDMNCIMCNGKIDRPTNLITHLGIDQTKKYLKFCEESHTTPSLYCCGCYRMVERNPDWQKSMDEMVEKALKFGELKKLYENKLEMVNE